MEAPTRSMSRNETHCAASRDRAGTSPASDVDVIRGNRMLDTPHWQICHFETPVECTIRVCALWLQMSAPTQHSWTRVLRRSRSSRRMQSEARHVNLQGSSLLARQPIVSKGHVHVNTVYSLDIGQELCGYCRAQARIQERTADRSLGERATLTWASPWPPSTERVCGLLGL
jgi:hypothetical protein